MKRLRVLFAVFTVALLAPIALLVQRSLHSVAVERRLQLQTVAERIFDEMERDLSRLLESEEGRPVDAYDAAAASEHDAFILRRFEVAAREVEGNEAALGTPPAAPADEDHAGGRDAAPAVGDDLANVLRAPPDAEPLPATRQAPGTTVLLERGTAAAGAARRKSREAEASEYDVMRSLNKAVQERADLRYSISPRRAERAADVPALLDLPAGAFGRMRMTGRPVGADRILLYRTVARTGDIYHQGIVIDVATLGVWLRERSITGTALQDYASLDVFAAAATPQLPVDGDAAAFRHRFAAPFAALSAHLRLRPLATGGSDLYVPALSFSLVTAILLGLALLYRAVAVTMRFAERRSNFAAAVSHELKTPLTAIRMYGEMLRDGVVPNEAKRQEYYRHITSESERLSRLINNVLEFAKLEKGNHQPRPIRAPLGPLLAEVVEMMRPHAAGQGYELTLEMPADLPAARHEPDALAQVLWNLIDNAVKYGRGTGDRRVEVSARRDGALLVIAVRDHGPGVDPRHLPEIFTAFYRGEDELTRTATGAGLGLALVRSLVERMGGSVRGFNHAGGGFAVEISLPVDAAAPIRESGTGNREPRTGNWEPRTGNREPGTGNRER